MEIIGAVGYHRGRRRFRPYNMKVVQDGHLGWVTNYGLETWVVLKNQGDKWKILSNIGSSHGAPR
jgi:hypothetical protein